MAKSARSRSDGLRELLIGWREYTLPKSPPEPPKWSAPAGWPDPLLDDLRAGEAVVVRSYELLSAMVAAGLPPSTTAPYCFGGQHYKTTFVLGEDDSLAPYVEWEEGRVPRPVDGLRRRLIANRQRFLARRPAAGDDECLEALQAKVPVAVRGWELRAAGVECDDRVYVLESDDGLRPFVYGVDDKAEQ
jgi:hypothetical protein